MAGVLAELIGRSGCAQRGTSFQPAIAGPQLYPLGGSGHNAALTPYAVGPGGDRCCGTCCTISSGIPLCRGP